MKRFAFLAFPLFVSCAALSGADGSGPDAAAIGDTAGGIATAVTGNPAIGVAVGTLVGGVATWLYGKKKTTVKA